MIGSKLVSGLGRSVKSAILSATKPVVQSTVQTVLCETLETRSLFSTSVALDPSFGSIGLVQTSFGGTDESALGVIALKDGRALVSGYSSQSDGDHSVLAAYNKDGSLSTAFDGDGKLVLSAAVTSKLGLLTVPTIYQTPDGGLLVAGQSTVLKLKLNGSIDTSYGVNGYATRLPAKNADGYYNTVVQTQLSDGTFREVSLGTYEHTLSIQDISASGKVTRSVINKALTLPSDNSQVGIDVSGITVTNTGSNSSSNTVYRFNFDLTPMTSFGTNGVVDVQAAFNAWANTKKPWAYSDGDPVNGIPDDLQLNATYDAKSGIGIIGRVDEVSSQTTTTYPPGLEGPHTQIDFAISADGKTITIDSGPVKGTLLAHTVYDPYGGTGEDGFEFGGTFYTTDGQVIDFDAQPGNQYSNPQTQASVAASTDGGYYVVGTGAIDGKGADSGFVVSHTAPLATASKTATIAGTLYNDDNGDQQFDISGETINAGKIVYLDTNNNGKLDSGERSTTTDSFGRYQFSNVTPGSYHVRRVLPSGYQITTSDAAVTAANGQVTDDDIGSTARALITASVKLDGAADSASYVFVDTNKNGVLDDGEQLLNYIAAGQYRIALPAGTYRIAVTPANGTVPATGSNAAYDITVKMATQTSVAFNLTKPVASGTVSGKVYIQNSGSQPQTGVSNDKLFVDLNKNGVQDAGEQSVLTDTNGNYSLSLQPGSYRIVAQTPGGTQPISNPSGYADVTVTSGATTALSFKFADNGAYPGKITGTLFNDDNSDGLLDNGETVNGNRTVFIDANHNGKLDSGEKSTTTDNNGVYVFTGLAAGTYDIKRVLPSSDYRITTSTSPVNLAAGNTVVFNIGSTSKKV